MYVSTEIADRIKELSKKRNVPLKQMLADIGLGSNTMANMKTSMPKADNLARIADYLDCSTDYLLGRSDDAKKSPSMPEEDQQLLHVIHALDARDQGKVLGYAESLLSAEKYSAKDASRRA